MGVCNVPLVDKVCDAVGGVVEKTGQAITDGIGAWIAKSMGELAASAADLAARAVDTTTAVDLNASWFRANYELLLPIGLVLIVATFCAQLVRAAVRRDEQALSQAVTGTVVGVMFQFGAIAFTSVALTVIDALSAGVWAASGTSVEAAVRRICAVSTFGAMFPLGWAVPALVALVCAIGMFLYWGIMVFRKVAILILVTLAVFAGAGGGWEAARRWRRGWVEATATLVVSKLLMTIVFALGVAAMGQSNTSDGLSALSDAMAGIVVIFLVLLCPMITFKFVHWAGETSGGADLTSAAGAGAATAYGAAKKAAGKANSMRPPAAGTPAVRGAANGVAQGIPANPAGFSPPTDGASRGANTKDQDESAGSASAPGAASNDAVSKLAAAGVSTKGTGPLQDSSTQDAPHPAADSTSATAHLSAPRAPSAGGSSPATPALATPGTSATGSAVRNGPAPSSVPSAASAADGPVSASTASPPLPPRGIRATAAPTPTAAQATSNTTASRSTATPRPAPPTGS